MGFKWRVDKKSSNLTSGKPLEGGNGCPGQNQVIKYTFIKYTFFPERRGIEVSGVDISHPFEVFALLASRRRLPGICVTNSALSRSL